MFGFHDSFRPAVSATKFMRPNFPRPFLLRPFPPRQPSASHLRREQKSTGEHLHGGMGTQVNLHFNPNTPWQPNPPKNNTPYLAGDVPTKKRRCCASSSRRLAGMIASRPNFNTCSSAKSTKTWTPERMNAMDPSSSPSLASTSLPRTWPPLPRPHSSPLRLLVSRGMIACASELAGRNIAGRRRVALLLADMCWVWSQTKYALRTGWESCSPLEAVDTRAGFPRGNPGESSHV